MFKRYLERFIDQENFLLKLLLGAAALLWLAPAFSPLWCDETITYWMIAGGWAQALHRALSFQEWSTAYFMLEKACMAVGGGSEFMLRLPSLAAAAAATRAVYLLAKRLGGIRAGLPAAIVFAVSAAVAEHAAEARPYAFSLAFVTLSTLYLVKTLDGGKPRDAVLYALFAALAAYMQLLSAVVLAVHLLYWTCRRFIDKDVGGVFPAALAGAAVLMLPLLIPARSLFARHAALLFSPYPGTGKFILYVLQRPLIFGAAAGLLLTRPTPPSKTEIKALPVSTLALALGLALLPPLIFFCAGYMLHARIWVPRYFMYSQAGTALCAGILLGMIRQERALRVTLACIAAAILMSHTRFSRFYADWRDAAAYSSQKAAGLNAGAAFISPFIESMQPGWRDDAGKASYLTAPLTYYPAGVTPAVLPLNLTPENKEQVAESIKTAAGGRDAMMIFSFKDPDYADFIKKCLAEDGFFLKEQRVGVNNPAVAVYVRPKILP